MEDTTIAEAPARDDTLTEWLAEPPAPQQALAASWIIDPASGRPTCRWSLDTWRVRPQLLS